MSIQFTTEQVEYKTLDFLGFNNYRVGSDGSVWSRWAKSGRRWVVGKWNRMKLIGDRVRGLSVSLSSGGGNRKRFLVHRLVLTAFVGQCPEGMECCHFPDGDRTNNQLSNLRWDTKSANERDKVVHGTTNRGERCGTAKLTEDDVRSIRRLYSTGRYSQKKLADVFEVQQMSISFIVRRVNWAHVV